MKFPALEALRHALIAAQLRPDPGLRQLAVLRYVAVDNAIAARPLRERADMHAELLAMLPSEWPLWVERFRPLRRVIAA